LKRLTPLSRSWAFYIAVAAGLIAIGLLTFSDFVFGGKTLLFTEFGSDSINIFYPFYILLSDHLREVGIPSWSFRIAMGQDLFPYFGNLLIAPVTWLPKNAIARALVYQHLLYVLATGLIFARFLADRGFNFVSCWLGALLLSFSAYMCAGSCWYFHAQEVVGFTWLMFAAEQAVVRGRWLYLALAVALVALLGSFHLYLCALFLCFYVPFRFVEQYGWQPQLLVRTSILLALVAALGLGLSAIISMDNFYALLNSPRGSGLASKLGRVASYSVFTPGERIFYSTAMLRPFGAEMLGTGDDYYGWYNYFEAPMNYCGLLCLVIVPQVFVGIAWHRRILYGVFFTLITVVTIFPWFRYLFWAFQGEYFRAFSLFCILGIITLSVTAFSRYMEGKPFNLWLLALTILILNAILYLPIDEVERTVNRPPRLTVTIFLLVYAVLLGIGQIARRQTIAGWVIGILSAIELIYFGMTTVSARHAVTKEQLKQRVGYNDRTADVLRDLNAQDSSFFRITKTWGSSPSQSFPSLNDSMVFGFYGTTAQNSFNNANYTKFLMAVEAISAERIDSTSHWSTGLTLGNPLLLIFAGEKYVITPAPEPYEASDYYKLLQRYDGISVFANQMFVPFGLIFSRSLSEATFLQLPTWAKPQALLRTVVFSDVAAVDQSGLQQLTADGLHDEIYGHNLADVIIEHRNTALKIHSFSQTRINGSVHLDAKSILVLQTPYDPGWRASQDGRPAPVLKVDVGLLGVALEPGEHNVELRYRPPFVVVGTVVSLISAVTLLASRLRWPRLRLPA
jgi:uncharacterized membrane protein YfhO